MTKQLAIEVMQAHLGDLYIVVDVDLDNDGDWLGCITPADNDGETIGLISIDYDGNSVPWVSWD